MDLKGDGYNPIEGEALKSIVIEISVLCGNSLIKMLLIPDGPNAGLLALFM